MGRRVSIGAINSGWPVLVVFLCACMPILAAILSEPASSASGDESKRVLILHPFGRDFGPWGQYARAIRQELERLSPWQLDIQEHSLITARFDEDPEPAFIAYLNALNSKHSPDIVISIGAPAANFAQRNRMHLFPATPMVLTAVEQRRIQLFNLSDNDTVVAVAHDFPRSFETILRVLPATKQIVVINGASPNERFWQRELHKEAELVGDKVRFIWYEDISFVDILKKSAALPPDTAIFWHLMNVDATGVAYEGDAALRRLYAVSSAPIFSYDDGFFGREIVGGPMHSVPDLSRLTASVAIRILGGEKPSDIKSPVLGYARPKFDWREMQRWRISEDNLPPESQVLFREPRVWEKYRWQVFLIACVILIQGALISGLLRERHRRRVAEVESRQRLAELAHLNRHSTFNELTSSIAHEINQPLGSILANAETAEILLRNASPNLDEVKEILVDIRRDDQRASEVIRRLHSMLKKTPFEMRDIDLNGSIREVSRFVTAQAHGCDIELKHATTSADLYVKGDPIQLQQVILNLIINAMDAISETQAKKREVSVTTKLSGAFAEIRVSDTGPGISADNLKNIFDPFFTTKPQGMGMGLAIVRTVVEAHQGRISAENHASGGAQFTISIPVARTRSTSA